MEIFPPPQDTGKVRDIIGKYAGVSGKTVDKFKYIEKHAPEKADLLCAGDVDEDGKKLSIDGVYKDLIRENARAELMKNLESIESKEAKAIEGVYDVIVIDPPWEIGDPFCVSEKAGYNPAP